MTLDCVDVIHPSEFFQWTLALPLDQFRIAKYEDAMTFCMSRAAVEISKRIVRQQ